VRSLPEDYGHGVLPEGSNETAGEYSGRDLQGSMLDDITYIPKPRFALFDIEVFSDRQGFNLSRMRKLVYGISSHWKLMLIALARDDVKALTVKEQLVRFGLNVEELIIVDASYSEAKLREYVTLSDIVYAPCLKTLPVKFFDSRYRQPKNADQAIDALVYFSGSIEDFNYQTYYAFLSRTDT